MHPIDSLFDWFLSATARGSMLILAVLLVQAALGRRLPAVWRHALWLPVLFVLGAPALPESPLSLENRWSSGALPVVALQMEPVSSDANEAFSSIVAAPAESSIDWSFVAGGIWFTGACAVWFTGWIACRRTLAAFRREAKPLDSDLQEEIREAAMTCGLRSSPRVLLSTAVPGPAMTGLFRPLLLLPADFGRAFDHGERQFILLHECTHVKRGDLLLNAIAFVLQGLHWCNPLVWFAFLRLRADRELACDSAVLSQDREDGRARYGHVLLKVERTVAPVAWRLGFIGMVGLFGRGRILHSRVAAIAGHRRSHPLWNLAGPGMLLALALTGATRAQDEPAVEGGKQIVIETKFIEVPADAVSEVLTNEATPDQPNRTVIMQGDGTVLHEILKAPGAGVLSAPSVVTLSGQKATIEIGEEMPDAEGKPRHVGALVEILPTLKNGKIHLSLKARSTRVISAFGSEAPVFSDHEIKTEISVNPGDTLVISYMYEDEKPAPARRLLLTVRAHLAEDEGALRARLEKIIIPEIEFRDVPLSDALVLLRKEARDFDPEKKGVNLVHIPAEGAPEPLITVSFKEIPLTEALKYLAALSGLDVDFGDAAVVLHHRSAMPAPLPWNVLSPTGLPAGTSRELASRLVLPRVEFKEAPLNKILQFLQQKSLELDPAKKGLNLILDAPGDPSPEAIRISLNLSEVLLSETLRYVAELANLKLRYEDDAIVLFRDK